MSAETIFALATAPGRAGIAVIRVSGPAAWNSAKILTGKAIPDRKPLLCALKNPSSGETIDRALLIAFKAPSSYTGEDVIEYHVHGGIAVTRALLDALARLPSHRMAEPGEFTRRAFENGKMDLTEAEAVADLIDAETESQRRQALAQMEGGLSKIYRGWTEDLKNILAHIEADLEFPDEDLPEGTMPQSRAAIKKLNEALAAHLNDNRRGERLRNGIHVAVIGAPNAGKSSLVNALAQRDVAIVSPLAGTTRDIIEAHLDLGGYPVILSDTAGLRPDELSNEGHDSIESEGIRRALERAEQADIKLLLFDATEKIPDAHTLALLDENSICAANKIDSAPSGKFKVPENAIPISVKNGEGLDTLLSVLVKKSASLIGNRETPSLTRQRHRLSLEEARTALARALGAPLPELMAEDVRLALRSLGRITGRVDVEDLLDVIFRDFCIGK